MHDQPILSEAEWALVMELLEQELHELPVEIRHTRSMTYHDDLHRRREMVQELVERLRSVLLREPVNAGS